MQAGKEKWTSEWEGRRGLLAVSTDGAVLRPGMGSVAKWLGSLGVIRGHSETGSRKSSAAAPLRRGSSLRDSIPNHQYETVQCRAHSCLQLQSYTLTAAEHHSIECWCNSRVLAALAGSAFPSFGNTKNSLRQPSKHVPGKMSKERSVSDSPDNIFTTRSIPTTQRDSLNCLEESDDAWGKTHVGPVRRYIMHKIKYLTRYLALSRLLPRRRSKTFS